MTGDALEYANQTLIHPFGLAILILAMIAVFGLPKKYVLIPIVFIFVGIPSAQRIVIFGADFNFVRLIVLAGLIRLISFSEYKSSSTSANDRLIVIYGIWGTIAAIALYSSASAGVARVGYLIEVVGAYLLGRHYVRSSADFTRLAAFLAVLSVPYSILFLIEMNTGRNWMYLFGGVPEFTLIRNGSLRCQGPFSHPLMAGVFWATCLPLFLAIMSRMRALALLGITCATLIVVTSASSTPLLAIGALFLALSIYPMRKYLKQILWCCTGLLVFLHFAMNAPVWHLISRIDLVGGSTGWHRYLLIDQTIRRVSEWFLFGTQSTAHWGWGMRDVTNQYALEAVRGGIVGLSLFVAMLYVAFRQIGRNAITVNSKNEWLVWCLGTSLFAHSVSFWGVSYFGAMVAVIFLAIGVASTPWNTEVKPSVSPVAEPGTSNSPTLNYLH